MEHGSFARRIAFGIGLWVLLSIGLSAAFFGLFAVTGAAPPGETSLAGLAFALGIVVTGLAFLAVVTDRLLFTREPTDFLTRQSVWVMVFVISVVVATGGALYTVSVTPGNAVLLGIIVGLPTTMLLFVAVNFARYRSMEYQP